MSDKPKAVAVSVGKENPIKRLWGSITGKNKSNYNPENKPRHFLNKPISFWIVLVIIIVLIIGGFFIYMGQSDRSKKTISSQGNKENCSNKSTKTCLVLKEASGLLEPGKVKELSVVVDKIKKTQDYDKNPNLLYVILTFYINLSDGTNARKNFNLLKNTYKEDVGYNSLLINAKKPVDLERIVVFLEKSAAEVDKNSYTVPPEPQ